MILEKLLKNAESAELTIKMLTERLAALRNLQANHQRESEKVEIEKLAKENEALRNGNDHLKLRLESLRVQNGAKAIPLPRRRPVTSEAKVAPATEQPQAVVKTLEAAEQKEANKPGKLNEKKAKKEGKAEKPKATTPANAKGGSDDAKPVDASRLDMRVGKIVNVERHPDADSLYIEKVDLGEEKPRTIVSGLVKHLKTEELQDRLAIFMVNLKPAKMRGVLSEGMIMCASSDKVQPLTPPPGSIIGDKVRWEGYTDEPDAQLNPKRKIWEKVKPDMLVNADGIATYKGKSFYVEGKGNCTSPIVKNCPIS